MTKILIIPDTQIKPGVPTDHLTWLGKYIVDLRPDIIVHLGDHYDLPSLSTYDKGTAAIEGRRLVHDLNHGDRALKLITDQIKKLQAAQVRYRKAKYNPRLIFLKGNHEDRLDRYINYHPELIGVLPNINDRLLGWEVYNYLEVIDVNGILFSHYFANPMSGKPYTGRAASLLQRVGKSFVMGHRQELDFTCRELVDGTKQIGIIAGAFYQHQEGYKGYQGNKHWRGVVVGHEINEGWFDPMFVSLAYLKRKYSNDK